MGSLRAEIESDLAETLEDDFGMDVTLIDPDGNTQVVSGQVSYTTKGVDPDTGGIVILGQTCVAVRISSLTRVPQIKERWVVRVPSSPVVGAALETYMLDEPVEHGRSIGFLRLYLRKAEQSA
jgi:hypothetical protein